MWVFSVPVGILVCSVLDPRSKPQIVPTVVEWICVFMIHLKSSRNLNPHEHINNPMRGEQFSVDPDLDTFWTTLVKRLVPGLFSCAPR